MLSNCSFKIENETDFLSITKYRKKNNLTEKLMKNKTILILILFTFFSITADAQKQDKNAPKVTFEDIQAMCPKVPLNKRVRLSVSSFKSATPTATAKFGDELSQMLTNALQNVNCFNVLLSQKDIAEITDEIEFAQSGNVKQGKGPKTGQMQGAQVIVMGKVTEYADGSNTTNIGGLKFGKNIAKLGFIVQLINAETREIIDSKSVNVEGNAGGFKGMSFLSVGAFGSTSPSNGNKAIADAMEKGIIEAVEFIASSKDDLPFPEAQYSVEKVYSQANCPLLNGTYVPKIMVILPEYHITQRIPDPAAETEINRKLIEAGFPVVDPAMFATKENNVAFINASKNPMLAISLGKKFGADIVIYGEAFSERTGIQGKQVTCRARVEVRAVRTDDATIIAANGLEAGALDNGEFVAAKSALRSAGGLVVDYLLGQFCTKNLNFEKPKIKK